ncbi:MAG: type II 3-dehydroquinate dehydratase [Burkholderiaceae bacterium]
MSNRLLVVHGVGMNMRGKVQVETFGPMTLPEYDQSIRQYADELSLDVEIYHSNIEGEVINYLYAANEQNLAGAIINPAAYMSGYPALCAAISQVSYPVWELHISNPARRGLISEVGGVAQGVITGFGIYGYRLAMQGIKQLAANSSQD